MPQWEHDGLVIYSDDYEHIVKWLENDFGYNIPKPEPELEPEIDRTKYNVPFPELPKGVSLADCKVDWVEIPVSIPSDVGITIGM